MWGHMYTTGGCAIGSFAMLIWWALFAWFIIFTVLVVLKLDKITQLLEKK